MMKALRNARAAHNGVAYDHCRPPAAHICTSTALLDEIRIADRYEYLKFKADISQGPVGGEGLGEHPSAIFSPGKGAPMLPGQPLVNQENPTAHPQP